MPSPTPSSLKVDTNSLKEDHIESKKMNWTAQNNVQEINQPRLTKTTMMNPPVPGNWTPRTANNSLNIDKRPRKLWEPEIDHFQYLKKCWDEQIELSLSVPQKRNIYSFKNALVATGYEKILVMWQGMFYEVSKMDIELHNLSRAFSGVWS